MTPAFSDARLAPGRRERKKSAQRRSLQEAALRLADEHGYKLLTVEAIAEAADVSARTFFNYFASKDDALLSPGPEVARDLMTSVTERPDGEPAFTAVRIVLRESARTMADDLELWQARMRVVDANPHLWARLSSSFHLMERALATGIGRRLGSDPRADPYTVLVASCACTALRVALTQWRRFPDRPLPDRLDDLLGVLAAGLAQPPDPAFVPAVVPADPDEPADDLLVSQTCP